MLNGFKFVGLSHHKVPVPVREKFYLKENECRQLLQTLREYLRAEDLMVLSTCNRTEIYYTASKDYSEEIIKILLFQKNIPDKKYYLKYFETETDHAKTMAHLFHVAAGLDSQILGDVQIPYQVKQSYSYSADANLASPFLHRLMHTIFHANKRIQQETSFRDGAASLSYAAVRLAEDLTTHIENPSILIIGLGKIGMDAARNLRDTHFKRIAIANRTFSKAKELADEIRRENTEAKIRIIKFNDVFKELKNSDTILCALNTVTPFLTTKELKKLNLLTHKYIIDLSVPRSVEEKAEEIHGVVLYNLDEIKAKADETLRNRRKEIPRVEKIISEMINEFNEWTKETEISPVINKMKDALEQIRQDELKKYLKGLNEKDSERVEKITRGMMQKILKLPVLQLKAACKRGEAETLIDALTDLFDLEKSKSNPPQADRT